MFHIETVSIERRIIRPKEITLANHERRKQRNEPIRTEGKWQRADSAKRGKTRVSESQGCVTLF